MVDQLPEHVLVNRRLRNNPGVFFLCLPGSTGPPSAIFIFYLWILKVKLARFDQKTSIAIGIHKKAPIARWQLYVEGAKLKIDSSYPKEFLEWDSETPRTKFV